MLIIKDHEIVNLFVFKLAVSLAISRNEVVKLQQDKTITNTKFTVNFSSKFFFQFEVSFYTWLNISPHVDKRGGVGCAH